MNIWTWHELANEVNSFTNSLHIVAYDVYFIKFHPAVVHHRKYWIHDREITEFHTRIWYWDLKSNNFLEFYAVEKGVSLLLPR